MAIVRAAVAALALATPAAALRLAMSSASATAGDWKLVVVTGGVLSGVGKGVAASAVGVLLQALGLSLTCVKIDPYLNVDAGTMSPAEHGETFVLDDGAETDLDLGNYERFLNLSLTQLSSLTTGKVYASVIDAERRGAYLGKTVQIIPHVTDEIMRSVGEAAAATRADAVVLELGGTVGDIESMPFVEALRQLSLRRRRQDFCLIHVSMVPELHGEQKTKPTQHSVKELRALGLSPDFVLCRSTSPLTPSAREKIALFGNLPVDRVLSAPDVANVYAVPALLAAQALPAALADRLALAVPPPQAAVAVDAVVRRWDALVAREADAAAPSLRVAVVAKYPHRDAYLSVASALRHACAATSQRLDLTFVDAAALEDDDAAGAAWTTLRAAHGVLVPGGFGARGFEGKVAAVRFARTQRRPFLGLCLGLQAAVVEFTRTALRRHAANSEEFVDDLRPEDKAIVFLPEVDAARLGGTMRLGLRQTRVARGSRVAALYGDVDTIAERHRHRYEVNPTLLEALETHGLRVSGRDDSGLRAEVVELPPETHPFFVGVQFHPEFKSRPFTPAPLFLGFVRAARDFRDALPGQPDVASEQQE